MRNVVVGFLLALGPFPPVLAVELGEVLPGGAKETGELLLTAPGELRESFIVVEEGQEFIVCLNDEERVTFISPAAENFETSERAKKGMALREVLTLTSAEVVEWSGWGYSLGLPSGWHAVFVSVPSMTERAPLPEDKVAFLFKGGPVRALFSKSPHGTSSLPASRP